MSGALYFEQLDVGQTWTSECRTITESDVVQFAGMTGDFNPLHVDHEFAKDTAFRGVIAHGLLGLSWVAGLGSHFPHVRTEAFLNIEQWEFKRAAFIGDTVHVHTELLEKQPSGRRRGKAIWQRQLINHKQEVLQSGRFVTLVARQPATRRRVDGAEGVRRPHRRPSHNQAGEQQTE